MKQNYKSVYIIEAKPNHFIIKKIWTFKLTDRVQDATKFQTIENAKKYIEKQRLMMAKIYELSTKIKP